MFPAHKMSARQIAAIQSSIAHAKRVRDAEYELQYAARGTLRAIEGMFNVR
jgi:hypothetical protein